MNTITNPSLRVYEYHYEPLTRVYEYHHKPLTKVYEYHHNTGIVQPVVFVQRDEYFL